MKICFAKIVRLVFGLILNPSISLQYTEQTLQTTLTSLIQDFMHLFLCVFASDVIHFIFEQGVDSASDNTWLIVCAVWRAKESQSSFET